MPDRAPISHPDFQPVELSLVRDLPNTSTGADPVPVQPVPSPEAKVQEGSQAHPETVEEKSLVTQIADLLKYEADKAKSPLPLSAEQCRTIAGLVLEAIQKLNQEVVPQGSLARSAREIADLERLTVNYITHFVRTKVKAPMHVADLFPCDELGAGLVRSIFLGR